MNDNLSSRMILPMSEYSFVEPGKKWLMRVSTNNQAMRVDILLVTSAMDFEVEEDRLRRKVLGRSSEGGVRVGSEYWRARACAGCPESE